MTYCGFRSVLFASSRHMFAVSFHVPQSSSRCLLPLQIARGCHVRSFQLPRHLSTLPNDSGGNSNKDKSNPNKSNEEGDIQAQTANNAENIIISQKTEDNINSNVMTPQAVAARFSKATFGGQVINECNNIMAIPTPTLSNDYDSNEISPMAYALYSGVFLRTFTELANTFGMKNIKVANAWALTLSHLVDLSVLVPYDDKDEVIIPPYIDDDSGGTTDVDICVRAEKFVSMSRDVRNLIRHGEMKAYVTLLRTHKEQPIVLCKALYDILSISGGIGASEGIKASVTKHGICELLMEMLQANIAQRKTKTITSVLSMIGQLAFSEDEGHEQEMDEIRDRFASAGARETMVDLLKNEQYRSRYPSLIAALCGAISSISSIHPVNAKVVGELGACELLMDLLADPKQAQRSRQAYEMVWQACETLGVLVVDPGCLERMQKAKFGEKIEMFRPKKVRMSAWLLCRELGIMVDGMVERVI